MDKNEILGKSRAIKKHSKASESIEAYEDLLNTTSDFYTEIMFAVLSQLSGYNISLNKTNDFVVDNKVAEVKSIHDIFDTNLLDKNARPFLQMSLTTNFSLHDLKQTIAEQVSRNKWKYHISKAIKKQNGNIILVNATQSQGLQPVSIFLEEKKLRQTFNHILDESLAHIKSNDSNPVLVILETMGINHIVTPFWFPVPITNKFTNPELDLNRYNVVYITNNLHI